MNEPLMYLISCEKSREKSRKKVGKKKSGKKSRKKSRKKLYKGEENVGKDTLSRGKIREKKLKDEKRSSAKFAWHLLGSKKIFSFFLSFYAPRFLFSPLDF